MRIFSGIAVFFTCNCCKQIRLDLGKLRYPNLYLEHGNTAENTQLNTQWLISSSESGDRAAPPLDHQEVNSCLVVFDVTISLHVTMFILFHYKLRNLGYPHLSKPPMLFWGKPLLPDKDIQFLREIKTTTWAPVIRRVNSEEPETSTRLREAGLRVSADFAKCWLDN